EGAFRPTHFDGVATVVLKLFNILPSSHAFFGRKDYQQLKVIEAVVRDINVPVEVMGCPIVRESDGLAMSSRNRYLDSAQRDRALRISASLQTVHRAFLDGERAVSSLEKVLHRELKTGHPEGVDEVEYATIVDGQTLDPISVVDRQAVALVAARVGTTRLIDNQILTIGGANDD
ncbi:MAG: pantoate--beta-alanine ligase, partial [Planctomycetota bacterium]